MTTLPQSTLEDENIENFYTELEVPDDLPIYNLMHGINVPQNINPVFYDMYTPPEHTTYQTLSYKFYGTIKLWWLICLVNNMFDISTGTIKEYPLKIIKPQFIGTILSELKASVK